MKKASTPSFVITLPLVAKGRDLSVMRKRFEAGRRLYNALLAEGLRRLSAMRRDPR
jgi:putative transposase